MTTAHHLRLIDEMRTREFPAERVPSGSGVSGPGYHTVFLYADDASDDGAVDEGSVLRRSLGRRIVFRLPESKDTISALVLGVDPLLLELNDRMLERLALGGTLDREQLVEAVVAIWLHAIYGVVRA